MSIYQTIDKIVKWAESESNILALVQTGSLARDDKWVDEYSDCDIELICQNPSILTLDEDWLHNFGDICVILSFDEGQEYPTKLVIFDDMIKIDFSICDKNRIKSQENKLCGLYDRGYRIIIDKNNICNNLPKASGKSKLPEPPSQKEYIDTIREFWFEAAHIPKYLARDDLWIVKFRDWTMKEMLLRMLEWNAQVLNQSDTWHIGTHMKEWVTPEQWSSMFKIFSHFEAKDSYECLLHQLDLFRVLSKEIGIKLNYEYPEDIDAKITDYIKSLR